LINVTIFFDSRPQSQGDSYGGQAMSPPVGGFSVVCKKDDIN